MQRTFSDAFDFPAWEGVRARQFDEPSDAFQQLIGDALKETFGAGAWVAATAGRDGGIDVWVEASAAVPVGFPAFGGNFVVECKRHDPTAKDPKRNIEQEWRRVAAKLIEQAAAGWQGTYEPWRIARGYLYSISMRFPDQDFRHKFRESIRDFFDALPEGQRPPIIREHIHVWDWSDLAAWLRGSGRLADQWLGLPVNDLVVHSVYRQRIGRHDDAERPGFRAYLLAENLPFVPPPDDDGCHPDRLWARLQGGESLLLIGEGGIGKTRTAFEVAELADKAGWRVLHLDPPESGIDPRALARELAVGGDTLLAVDYIDKIQNFDARYWRQTLLPEVARRGGRLRLIANARPADSQGLLAAVKDSGLFATVLLDPSHERRRAVAAAIERSLCPCALATLGEARVRELCGSRPIIAMFVARELEVLAAAGQLALGLEVALRPGDLVGWLSRRLRDADLIHQPRGSAWDAVPPGPGLCAATAVLAAAPMVETELRQVAEATLATAGGDRRWAERCVDLLRRSGWLEVAENGLDLRTPHDIVADETLARLLAADPSVLPWILASAQQGRPLGRFALSLGRIAGGSSLLDVETAAAIRDWLEREAGSISAALTTVRPDVAAYALGAVFDCPYWSDLATAHWSNLVAPWLQAFGTDIGARHLLHRGLKIPDAPVDLLHASLSWIARHGDTETAGYVLAPLLAWDAARLGDYQTEVLARALAWLERHGETEAAEFVLHPLLAWDVVRCGERQEVGLLQAVIWLERHYATDAARFVLHQVLAWDAARLGARQAETLRWAMAWLKVYGGTEAAGYVLAPMLDWDAVRLGEHQEEALSRAMAWLAVHCKMEAAAFVLCPLMAWNRKRLGKERQGNIVALAMQWLEIFPRSCSTNHLLASILVIPQLDHERGRWCERAVARLHVGTEECGDAVLLSSLLQVASWYAEQVDVNDITAAACDWLDRNVRHPERLFILARLLRLLWLPGDFWNRVAVQALIETEAAGYRQDDDYLLNSVLRGLAWLRSDVRELWVGLAIRWLSQTVDSRAAVTLVNDCTKYFLPEMREMHLAAIVQQLADRRLL